MLPAKIEEYIRPATVADALAAIARFEEGDGIFLAGGQSIMQAIKSRMLKPRCIVDLQAIDELKGIRHDDGLRIGAMTRYVEIATDDSIGAPFAALRDAAARVGDRQVRNMGTIGGSVCWNYVAACLPAVVLGLGATLHLAASGGTQRQVAADDFFFGPFDTARADGEILTAISWDKPAPNTGSAYKKWGLVTDALPVIGVCAMVTLDDTGSCSAARMALSGLAEGAQRVAAGEPQLVGSDGSPAAIEAALAAVVDSVDAQSDVWADEAYRQQLIRTIGAEVIQTAFDRARG